jgi:aspartate-semialdehyde dehydrogenase
VAIPLVMVLAPLQALVPIRRVVLSTYQSVSGAGQAAMDELFAQTRSVYLNEATQPGVFAKPIAFNVIPQIAHFEASGYTDEETKVMMETKKIMATPLQITATCVRVPVFVGHSLSVTIELEGDLTPSEARKALKQFPGVEVLDRPDSMTYATPIEVAGEDTVAVSRIRKDPSVPHGLSLWICCDNLRKGAALNAVQIAEAWVAL